MRRLLGNSRWNAGAIVALIALAAALSAWPAQKPPKKDEDVSQTLQLPKDLPLAVAGETRRLAFHVVPMSAKGLLTQQVRDGLKTLGQLAGKDPVLHIRAFVAGAGDIRRVNDLVSESFTARKQPLPALSLVEAGGLPLPGAQVLLEAVSAASHAVNPDGLAFFSPRQASSENPQVPVAPLVAKSLDRLNEAVKAAGVRPGDVTRVTCYLSSLDDLPASSQLVQASYPAAAADFIRPLRAPAEASAACEAVARLSRPSGARIRAIDSDGSSRQSGESTAVLIDAPQVVLTGTQESFGYEEKDARLALQRLGATLEQAGASFAGTGYTRYYALSTGIAAQLRKVRLDFFDAAHPPAGELLLWQGVASMDAGFAVDAVAAKE
jgi:enamine deaminase RidA (YjgF/YER057c/UK114 family)